MTDKTTPVFPSILPTDPGHSPGLTKREYYAALAMMGLCSNPSLAESGTQEIAEIAVIQADKLMIQLDAE